MKHFITIWVIMSFSIMLRAQIIFVDPVGGNDVNQGNIKAPLKTLTKAIDKIDSISNDKSVVIKLFPGLYVLNEVVAVKTNRKFDFNNRLIIEALIMPDDSNWTPSKMPVIQSLSLDNSFIQFHHSTGIQIEMNSVTIQGLKFLGNPNPKVNYYYPIARENDSLVDLSISQCIFIGDKFSAPIQGAIYSLGLGLNVSHCIFYNCKNGLLHFLINTNRNVADFNINSSLVNCIIYNAYEGAFWSGESIPNYKFENNIISKCKNFWIKSDTDLAKHELSNSIISDCQNYISIQSFSFQGRKIIDDKNVLETNIRKTIDVDIVVELINDEYLPNNYLNLSSKSKGYELNAGIFKNSK